MTLQVYFLGLGYSLYESLALSFYFSLISALERFPWPKCVLWTLLLLPSGDGNRGEKEGCCGSWDNNRSRVKQT